jgi:hypothetical protein
MSPVQRNMESDSEPDRNFQGNVETRIIKCAPENAPGGTQSFNMTFNTRACVNDLNVIDFHDF